ncbi:Protein of unknown function (DUF1194) [Rhizobium sp. 9140]|nr:Protein of unknown function (DUF1194) [Rhizobium sp. 9140]
MILAGIALLMGLSSHGLPSAPSTTGVTQITTIAALGRRDVDVELVLAVDMSGSMDLEEARIQRAGYLEALRHKAFIDAVRGGLIGEIAISYFEWAGSVNESSRVDWHVIASAADAAAFADEIAARPVTTRRGTSISNALTYATGMIDTNAFNGQRRVIDVSGDGPNNLGPPVLPARDMAVRSGIIVNGLAIIIRPTGVGVRLDRYYSDCVIGGPGAFVLPIHNPEDFGVAIRQKLVMEVSGRQPTLLPIPVANPAPVDCLIGEKLRPGFFDR